MSHDDLIRRAGLDALAADVVRKKFDSVETSGLLAMIGPEVSKAGAARIVYAWIATHKRTEVRGG